MTGLSHSLDRGCIPPRRDIRFREKLRSPGRGRGRGGGGGGGGGGAGRRPRIPGSRFNIEARRAAQGRARSNVVLSAATVALKNPSRLIQRE
jgi:hypothetical protein